MQEKMRGLTAYAGYAEAQAVVGVANAIASAAVEPVKESATATTSREG